MKQQVEGPFRPEIQALRAVAVASVVLYHLWPNRLTGGYVGVDMFFGISGFMIIGHLLREVRRTQTIDLLAFWARRARRLLPASLLVLVATGVATLIWVPQALWLQYAREIGASAVYVQNWVLSASSIDYLGQDSGASPVQHFWSLSVEEQFYIAWPIIILAVLLLRRWRTRARVVRILFVVLVVITAASLVDSIVGTALSPSTAYFDTTTRAWEFGAGGIVAFLTARRSKPRREVAAAMSWIGIALIALTLVTFTPATVFPSYTALLPVAGTLLVIAAGTPHMWWSPTQLARLRPVQWVGDVSYSLYLWHWPLLTILPFATGHPLGARSKIGVLVVAVLLAALTKRFVEDPGRSWKPLASRRPLLTILATVVATTLVVAGSGVVSAKTNSDIAAQAAETKSDLAKQSLCVGASAIQNLASCTSPFSANKLTNPTLARTDQGEGVIDPSPCKQGLTETAVITCHLGDTSKPQKVVALVGDSHAGQYLEPLDSYGKSHSIEFVTYLKSFCAGLGAPGVTAVGNSTPAIVDSCASWGKTVEKKVLDSSITNVIFTDFTSAYLAKDHKGTPISAADFTNVWKPLLAKGKNVIAIRDTPNSNGRFVPVCIAQHESETDPCSTPLPQAELAPPDNPMLVAAQALPAVHVLDFTPLFCTGDTCHTLIGGIVVYVDTHHVSKTYATTMAPYVGSAIDNLVPPGR